jgi:hypothetical protein
VEPEQFGYGAISDWQIEAVNALTPENGGHTSPSPSGIACPLFGKGSFQNGWLARQLNGHWQTSDAK